MINKNVLMMSSGGAESVTRINVNLTGEVNRSKKAVY